MHLFAKPIWPCLLAVCCTPVSGQEWTRFRGPNGSGQSETATIPAQWRDNDYNWRVDLPGIGHSSPVLWGEKIFLTSAEDQGHRRLLVCLDAPDGKILWKKEFQADTHALHVQNSFASSTPAVDEQRVYVAWATPEHYYLYALDHDGHEVWQKDLGKFISQHGFGTSPIVFRDQIVINNDQDGESCLFALDRATGDVRWKSPRQSAVAAYATPCVYEPQPGKPELIFSSQAHGISSIDPADGSVNWELPVFQRRAVGSPIVVAGLVMASCGEGAGDNKMVAVRAGEKAGRPAEVVYEIDKTAAPYVPSMVARDHLVFLWGDKGIVTCIDATTGKKYFRERVGGTYSGSPVRVADKIYCISTDGEVVVIAAADEFEVLGRNPLGEPSRSTPAVSGGRMYLRSQSRLASIGGKG